MSLSTRYTPSETEKKWYDHWMNRNYFHSEPDEREPYSIVIPPPNVTGVLHMGHMLNNTIQDILIRRARLLGYNACWVPGTDHASIATEAKVVKQLREKGIKKSDLTRDEFLAYAFEWKDKYGGIILNQLQKLGASCDWERTRFTLEPKLSSAVVRVFNDLHKKGKIYRGLRMTNWDPVAKTVLSNEEVIHAEEQSRLFYVKYKIEGTEDEWVTIATVRPETILGDSAIAVNPKDERFKHLHGKKAIVPLIGRAIPIIADRYVDLEFGTGCLKVTPAHDMNDYEIGERHGLEVIDVLNEDGTMSEAAQLHVGADRFKARKLIVKDLEASGNLVKIEDYKNKVGRSERTNAVVEPRLTLQWFLKMDEFAATALDAVKKDEVTFHPKNKMWNMYNSWLKEDNVKDWCISRQLWWGQQIPAWYYEDKIFVANTEEEALEAAKKETGNASLTLQDLRRDEDVVDTWFSSWLWPISVFDGFENTDELKYYYPTNTLVTGWDIMFFWVARMIMAGYEWSEELLGKDFVAKNGKRPFKDVYFTGMVRDAKRQKMSKSLGNSPDALALIENYGADGVRFGMLSSAAAGNDIIFDAPIGKDGKAENSSKLCEQGRNFCNKMWNALRLLKNWEVVEQVEDEAILAVNTLAGEWMTQKMSQTIERLNTQMDKFQLSDSIMELRKLIWDDYCSWYLEMIKPAYGQPIDRPTLNKAIDLMEEMMIMLHPFMPFVTEEIWHNLKERKEGEDCVVSTWPTADKFDKDFIEQVELAKAVVSGVRDIRNVNGIKQKDLLKVHAQNSTSTKAILASAGLKAMIQKMGVLESLDATDAAVDNSVSFLVKTDKFYVVLNKEIDTEGEYERLTKELLYYQGFVKGVEKKLSNERFVNNAPAQIVDLERKKLADGNAKIISIQEAMTDLGCDF